MVDIITYCYICQPKSYLPFCVSVVYNDDEGGAPHALGGSPHANIHRIADLYIMHIWSDEHPCHDDVNHLYYQGDYQSLVVNPHNNLDIMLCFLPPISPLRGVSIPLTRVWLPP